MGRALDCLLLYKGTYLSSTLLGHLIVCYFTLCVHVLEAHCCTQGLNAGGLCA